MATRLAPHLAPIAPRAVNGMPSVDDGSPHLRQSAPPRLHRGSGVERVEAAEFPHESRSFGGAPGPIA